MGAHVEPHPSVVRWIRSYRPGLSVVCNPNWETEEEGEQRKYIVNQMVLTPYPLDETTGLYVLKHDQVPALYVPQAQEIDRRWIFQLEANKIDKMRDFKKQMIAERMDSRRQMIADLEDHGDELMHAFKKDFGSFRTPNIKKKNAYDETRRHQDKLGRELKLPGC